MAGVLLAPYEQLTILPLPTPSANSNFSCPNAPRTRLQVGDTARVAFTDGKKSFLCSDPEAGEYALDRLPEGTEFAIRLIALVCTPRLERTDSYIYWKYWLPQEIMEQVGSQRVMPEVITSNPGRRR